MDPTATSSDHQIDTYLSPHSIEAIWRTIQTIIRNIRDLCSEGGSGTSVELCCEANFSDTVQVIELAWTRWRNRRHAAAVDDLALHTQLTSFLATMRVLQIACELGPMRLVSQQLEEVHHEALSLHVHLKDARRPPLSLGDTTIPPPVPLRPRCAKPSQAQSSCGPDDDLTLL